MPHFTRREFIKAAGGFVSAATLSPGLINDAFAADKRKRPNILFLMTDQHNHSVMGCSGNPVVKTPNLDRLALDGARFTNAVCATPFCSPTRASFVTGQWPHTHGIIQNVEGKAAGLPGSAVTTEQTLSDSGYRTYHMGKWHLRPLSNQKCYQSDEERTLSQDAYNAFLKTVPREKWDSPRKGDVVIDDVCYTPEMAAFHAIWKEDTRRTPQDLSIIGRQLLPPEYQLESWLADRCTELIHKHRDDSFMITWSVGPPHAFWTVPDPYYSMYDPAKMPIPPNWGDHPAAYQESQPARLGKGMGEKQVRETLRCYYGQVTMMDWCIGRILDALRKEGLERDTLVIFTSDHGDMQGGHGMVDKALPAYFEEIVRVPLIMRLPGAVKSGSTVKTHAGSVDMMPTILDFVGLPTPKTAQGSSLRSLAEGRAKDDDRPAFCERGNSPTGKGWSRMIRTKEWKYAFFSGGRRELFDLVNDPYEMKNLAEGTSHPSAVGKLHTQLREHMEKTGDPTLEAFPKA